MALFWPFWTTGEPRLASQNDAERAGAARSRGIMRHFQHDPVSRAGLAVDADDAS